MARLSDSVAPLVQTISRAVAPIRRGHLLAGRLDRLLGPPAEGVALGGGVAELSLKYGSIASSTRGSTGVVAW